jgi:hypothetical protein
VPSLPILNLITTIANLTKLETLVLSNLGLSGPLDDPIQPNLGLHSFRELRHLDISGNPGITGTLPRQWLGLTALQVLDISGCGVVGTLPAVYVSMQELQELRAANCTVLVGQLPPEFGLLNLKVLHLTNTALTGTLPAEWGSPAALRRMAIAFRPKASSTTNNMDTARSVNMVLKGIHAQPAAKGVAVGLQQLRVLDLSVDVGGRAGLSGSLPGSFAAMKHLQVWYGGLLLLAYNIYINTYT